MLTILGPSHRYCDGISRRNFLKVGALGAGGLTLPGLMRAEAAAGMKTGQVIGSTGSDAGEAKDDPVPYPSVLATVYKNLGLDPHAMVYDVSNRPAPILPSSVSAIDKVY